MKAAIYFNFLLALFLKVEVVLFGVGCYAVSMKNEVATKHKVEGDTVSDKYTITYVGSALQRIERLTEAYNLSKEEIIGLGIIALERLEKDGVVGLRNKI